MSRSFQKLATVTASTKRPGAVAAGLVGALAASVATLKCTPLDPVTADVAMMAGLESFAEVLMTMCEGGIDILAGDTFIVGANSYKIRAVAEWTWRPSATDTLVVLLEEIK